MSDRKNDSWMVGSLAVTAPGGERRVPVVATRLDRKDVIGGWKVRWGFARNDYRVKAGLYAVGAPDGRSPVLVTANYKLSFDALRKELTGIDAWILVLDTAGVNVWCAAGKGTFGTAELLRVIRSEKLEEVVEHRTLILPQLGASGVAAHEVAASGFSVIYGPVRAADIPAFFAKGMEKDDAMRRVDFPLADRMAVAPVELSHAFPFLAGAIVLAALFAIASRFDTAAFVRWAALLIAPSLVGTLLFPALLPYLPFRAFAVKGAILGGVWSGVSAFLAGLSAWPSLSFVLVATSLIAFLAMNFTGSSTYTCKTGAELEVRIGLPIMVAGALAGAVIAAAWAVVVML
jgi:hypothetical protein